MKVALGMASLVVAVGIALVCVWLIARPVLLRHAAAQEAQTVKVHCEGNWCVLSVQDFTALVAKAQAAEQYASLCAWQKRK